MQKSEINKYTYWIGENNESHLPEIEKAKDVMANFGLNTTGYTILRTEGIWNGIVENGFKIELLDFDNVESDLFFGIVRTELEKVLKQYKIILTKESVGIL